MSETLVAEMLLPEMLVAGVAVVVLFYAWRGLARLPLLPRLALGAMLGVLVPGAFGLTILTLSPHGRLGLPSAAAAPPYAGPPPLSDVPTVPQSTALAPLPVTPPAAPATAPSPTPAAPTPTPAAPEANPPPAPLPVAAEVAAVAPDAGSTPAGKRPAATEILFGTDRVRFGTEQQPRYTSGRTQRLELGAARLALRATRHASAKAALTDGAPPPDTDPAMPAEITALSRERFAMAAHETSARRDAIILVHGYNTGLDTGLADAARLAARLGGKPVAVYLYSWPSASGIASYSYDVESASKAAAALTDFIGLIAAGGARSVSLVAFDLGAAPALAALAQAPPTVTVRELVLVAPDLPADGFEQRIREVAARAGHVTVYASEGTRALDVARRFYGGSARAGETHAGAQAIIPGIDTIVMSPMRPPAAPQRDDALLDDLAAMLSATAPGERLGSRLEEHAKSGATYWRLTSGRR